MPVDIRSFFQKKAPANASKKTSSSSMTTNSNKAEVTRGSPKSCENAENAAKPKRKRQHVAPENDVIDVEDEKKTKSEEPAAKKVPGSTKKKKTAAPAQDKEEKGPAKRSSPPKRKLVIADSDDEDKDEDYVDDVEVSETKPKTSSSTRRSSSAKRNTTTKTEPIETEEDIVEISASSYFSKSKGGSPAKKLKPSFPPPTQATPPAKKSTPTKKSSTKKQNEVKPLAPEDTQAIDSFPLNEAAPECLMGYTFCVTALDPDWSREDATDYLKGLGARVTTAVSGKTDYLFVLGDILEDDRPYTEGSKYKKATELNTRIIVGRSKLHGVVKYHSEMKGGPPAPRNPTPKEPPAVKNSPAVKTASPAAVPAAAPAPVSATKVINNPYARAKNPYAKKTMTTPTTSTNPYASAKKTAVAENKKPAAKTANTGNMLWVDKYKPRSSAEILGNQDSVRKLQNWLLRWEKTFNKDDLVGKSFSNPQGPWKAVLLSGPPGIGKTTTATLIAQESGRHVLEFNASDVRSKSSLRDDVGDITGSRTLKFGKQSGEASKRVIIMDEVDGLGAGDRGGLAELIQMIKNSRVPIICICNDRQSQKIKSLVPYCMDLRYRRPVKSQIATRVVQVAKQEGFTVEQNAAEMLAESCGNDVRQCLNACQMWANETGGNSRMSYTNLKEREKSINKDEMLRVTLFDATRLILQGRNGLHGATPEAERAHFFKRNDAFFVDYNFTGLMCQQNYLSILKSPFSKAVAAKQTTEVEDILERMSKASEAMSDFALAEHKLRSDQNWSVLPFVASLTVKTGYHAGGEGGGFLGGFPEFSAWLGKNSSKGKKTRMVQDLQHHMNFRISGGSEEMRLSYLPVLRGRFLSLLSSKDSSGTDEVIELMDTYGLDRDDIIEKFDEFKMDPKDKGFGALDSKQKAALTRAYNAVSHRSQALVVEQGGAKKSRQKAPSSTDEIKDPDVVDDDEKTEEDEEEEDGELDTKAIAAMFKKKGRKAAPKKAGTKKTAPKRKKK
eukprot:scaffold316_cov158-Amphora_coffeaeformis.AAC.4